MSLCDFEKNDADISSQHFDTYRNMFLCFVIFVFNLDLWSISSLLLILTLYLCLHSSCFDHSKAPDLHRKAPCFIVCTAGSPNPWFPSFNSNPQTYLGRYSDTLILWILTLFFSCLFLFICLFLLCAQRIPFRETTMQNGMSILCPILKLQIFFFFFFLPCEFFLCPPLPLFYWSVLFLFPVLFYCFAKLLLHLLGI